MKINQISKIHLLILPEYIFVGNFENNQCSLHLYLAWLKRMSLNFNLLKIVFQNCKHVSTILTIFYDFY